MIILWLFVYTLLLLAAFALVAGISQYVHDSRRNPHQAFLAGRAAERERIANWLDEYAKQHGYRALTEDGHTEESANALKCAAIDMMIAANKIRDFDKGENHE
jgi:Tfp pilus assembly protein PilE